MLDYFDAAAEALESNPGKGSEILKVLGFSTGGRRESAGSKQLEWAQTVNYLMQKNPELSIERAIAQVAKQKGVSESSVKEAYNRFL